MSTFHQKSLRKCFFSSVSQIWVNLKTIEGVFHEELWALLFTSGFLMCKRRWERQRALNVGEHGSGHSQLGGVTWRINRPQGLRRNPHTRSLKAKQSGPKHHAVVSVSKTCFKHCRTSPWIHSRQGQLYNWLLGKFWKHSKLSGERLTYYSKYKEDCLCIEPR